MPISTPSYADPAMKASDVRTYNTVALEINAPIYTYYAGRILEKTGIDLGTCLDVGCGGGYLGLALAGITRLDFIFLDQSPEMLRCAEENIALSGLTTRARTLRGRVQAIPLAEASVDLGISRGSVPFWNDLQAAFREIHRVLKIGGCVYIGGGLGDPNTRAAVQERMRRKYPEWQQKRHQPPRHDNNHYSDALTAAGINPFVVTRNDEGLWITFRKG
jgi:ubiquinone/menaquinone biosynthesis C-methylase UbiE